ncbi:hypothetical protein CRV24_006428 [Beauveria bassiana]|nr:hypothetical protein CRV24_006428 [Beauveria bassiana]KAH8713447.1 hypothetical protein HC256_006605 [Beauveria bassiana]
MAFPELNAMVTMNEIPDVEINRGALEKHDRRQKEAVRKRGPSIQAKTQLLGNRGKICALSLYQCPSTGTWRLSVHCPAGKDLPDLNALVKAHKATQLALPIRAKL